MIPFGDRALRFTIPERAPRRRLFADLSAMPGVIDVVLAEDVGCIVFRDAHKPDDRTAALAVLARVGQALEDVPGSRHVIDVVYDGEDLAAAAQAIGRSTEDVIALHSGAEYRVAMLGFLPGFAYLLGLPDELRLPRRSPRPRVPAGSVAIAADYTGIYPFASPGGWHLLGRAPSFMPFDTGAGHATLAIGDVVRFAPSREELASEPRAAPPLATTATRPHLEITRAAGLALLVDGGRPGRMHEGVPAGGPLVRSALTRANALVGNDADACAVEVAGNLEVTARGGAITIADDAGARTLADGERHVLSTDGRTRVRYLALAGGIDAPILLGGRGALLVAGIGGLLRKGGTLVPLGSRSTSSGAVAPAPPSTDDAIAITPGPDADAAVLEALSKASFRIAGASDRTGTRLEGDLPAMAHAMARPSTPMVMGAIELTPSGLIVLGPDHPTTGGYPVVALVRSSSLDRFHARPIGSRVRFQVDPLGP